MNEVVSKRAEDLFINKCMASAHSDRRKVNLGCAAQGLKKNNQGQKNSTVTDFFQAHLEQWLVRSWEDFPARSSRTTNPAF